MFKKVEGIYVFLRIKLTEGAKCVKLVVGCSLLVDVSIHGGMLTMAGSWWGKKVITPYFFECLCIVVHVILYMLYY
jgi:hypothetical protein